MYGLPGKPTLTVKEAAEHLSVSEKQVHRFMDVGDLLGVNVSMRKRRNRRNQRTHMRVLTESVADFIKRRTV